MVRPTWLVQERQRNKTRNRRYIQMFSFPECIFLSQNTFTKDTKDTLNGLIHFQEQHVCWWHYYYYVCYCKQKWNVEIKKCRKVKTVLICVCTPFFAIKLNVMSYSSYFYLVSIITGKYVCMFCNFRGCQEGVYLGP